MPYSALWQKANGFYNNKSYDSAVNYYERLASLHSENAEIFYNLGNSYYRLNRIGPAVLNYERALRINPDYKEAQDNLELTQSRIGNRIQQSQEIFFVRWWQGLTKPSLSGLWSVVSLVLFLLTLTIILLRKWNTLPHWMRPQVSFLLIGFLLCTVLLAYTASNKKMTHNKAVVMEHDTPLRDNSKSVKIQLLLPEGTTLKIEAEQEEWMSVKLPDGRTGCVYKAAVEKI